MRKEFIAGLDDAQRKEFIAPEKNKKKTRLLTSCSHKKQETQAAAPAPTQKQAQKAENEWKEQLDKVCNAFQVAGGAAAEVNTRDVSRILSTQLAVGAHKTAWAVMRRLSEYLMGKCVPQYLLELWLSEKFEFINMMENKPLLFVQYFHKRINALEKAKREAKKSPAPIPTDLATHGACVPNECTMGKGISGNILSKTTEL